MASKITQYGFEYEAATVERCASHKGYAIIGIKTKRQWVHIQVTPSGLLRIGNVYPTKNPRQRERR